MCVALVAAMAAASAVVTAARAAAKTVVAAARAAAKTVAAAARKKISVARPHAMAYSVQTLYAARGRATSARG